MGFATILVWSMFLGSIPGQDGKAAVPGEAEVRKAEQVVRQLLVKEYAASASRQGHRALARKLVEQAAGAKNSAERYVVLRDAIDHSCAAFDFATLFKAIADLASSFDVKIDEVKTDAVTKAKKAATSPDDAGAVAEACLSLWEESMAVEAYDKAAEWAAEADRLGRRANDPLLIQAVKEMGFEASETKKEAAAAKIIEARAAGAALTPSESLSWGTYLCFVKDQWDKGLPLLANGSDDALKDLARKELAKPADAGSLFQLGKDWLLASEKMPTSLMKRRCAVRGRRLRDAALRSTQGIERTKFEKEFELKLTLTKITYASIDVTKRVQEEFKKDSRRPVCVFDEYVLAPDSAPENPKPLVVEYVLDGQRFVEKPPKGTAVFPGIPLNGVVRPDASQKLEVIEAYYGAGIKFVDATENARKGIREPYTPFNGNIGGGDPCPGKVKSLVVVYDWHGRRMVKVVREGELGILGK